MIVSQGVIIGSGYNAPPLDSDPCMCGWEYVSGSSKPRTDQTCCVHAEWRAIVSALRSSSGMVPGSTLYFTRINNVDAIEYSGKPYCTVCSRLARDVVIAYFALWHKDRIVLYDTKTYNDISYLYHLEH